MAANVALVAEVTVVIPTRDRWQLLSRHALRAARSQEDVDVEIVVVDDGSSDPTAAQVADLNDERVRALRHETSHGQSAARNAGVAATRTDWVAFLDDDDLWSPRKLRVQLDAAGRSDADFVWCGLAVVDPALRVLEVVDAPSPDGIATALLTRNVLRAGSSVVLARTAAIREVGGFDPRLDELADWDLWIRLALGGTGTGTGEVLAAYLLHPGNRRALDEGNVLAEYAYLRAKHVDVASRLGVTDGPLHFSRWLAMGHRRRGQRLRAAREYAGSGLRHRNVGNFVRAGAALLGEGVFAAGRRVRPVRANVGWLAAYR
jgi:glycosyltransferase involved in cell wall biosynthesis